MKKGGSNSEHGDNRERKLGREDLINNRNKFKRNKQRLGGKGGLSLESFANAKARNDNYNPSLIKKQREFYKNAKCVKKYKKSINKREHPSSPSTSKRPLQLHVANERNKKSPRSLQELYERKRREEEEAKKEREAVMQAKKQGRERAEARRKDLKGKMFKRTGYGQPVMKYRIEHILESIQGSTT